ncbi:hypothetical protein IWW41_006179 [Coemansia sp. RSA 2522]|nr:hypothetical protein IWW41_006179 [Coemansia sp. RSA 2522]
MDDNINTEFDKSGLEKSLPCLTIYINDGNLTYTNPEQLQRKRSRCFEKRSNRISEGALNYVKLKVQSVIPLVGWRMSKRVKQINSQLRAKIELFFVASS